MSGHTPAHFEKKRTEKEAPHWEVIECKRLLWTLLLLLTLLIGKQIYPERMVAAGEKVTSMLGNHTDLSAVFSRLGNSLNDSEELLNGIGAFCVEVFGIRQPEAVEQAPVPEPPIPESPVGLLSDSTKIHRILYTAFPDIDFPQPDTEIPAVGTVLTIKYPENGTLPAGYTLNELSFGRLKSVTPLTGTLTSGYGYRNHPVNGKYLFHGGVDIGAAAGTPIVAFADGQVEYVGSDDSYGLYFQIDHGNGIKSFYAHCQQIFVRSGQAVQAGERSALVGDTGITTGPHLHLELKCGDVRVDPSYYITLGSAA